MAPPRRGRQSSCSTTTIERRDRYRAAIADDGSGAPRSRAAKGLRESPARFDRLRGRPRAHPGRSRGRRTRRSSASGGCPPVLFARLRGWTVAAMPSQPLPDIELGSPPRSPMPPNGNPTVDHVNAVPLRVIDRGGGVIQPSPLDCAARLARGAAGLRFPPPLDPPKELRCLADHRA